MKTLFLCRYDINSRKDVSEVIKNCTIDKPLFVASPGNFVTIFNTEKDPKTIGIELSSLFPPVAYFLIEVDKSNIDFHFPSEIANNILNYISSTPKKRDFKKELKEALKIEDYLKAAEIQNLINNQNTINQ